MTYSCIEIHSMSALLIMTWEISVSLCLDNYSTGLSQGRRHKKIQWWRSNWLKGTLYHIFCFSFTGETKYHPLKGLYHVYCKRSFWGCGLEEKRIAKVGLEIISDPGTGPQQVGRVICSCAASDKLMLEAAHWCHFIDVKSYQNITPLMFQSWCHGRLELDWKTTNTYGQNLAFIPSALKLQAECLNLSCFLVL